MDIDLTLSDERDVTASAPTNDDTRAVNVGSMSPARTIALDLSEEA